MSESESANTGKWYFDIESYELAPIKPIQNACCETTILVFDGTNWSKDSFTSIEQLRNAQEKEMPTWLHIAGELEKELDEAICDLLNLSEYKRSLFTTFDTNAKIDEFTKSFFWRLNYASLESNEKEDVPIFFMESINFFMNNTLLITKQSSSEKLCFSKLINQIVKTGKNDCFRFIDEVAASTINEILESHMHVLQIGGVRLSKTQSRTLKNPSKKELSNINMAQQIVWIQLQNVWPVQHVINTLSTSKSKVISEEGRSDLSNLKFKCSYVIGLYESYREVTYDLMDLYSTAVSLRINESTVVLTIVATLFLPPTLIAGIYGMNFSNMPELSFPFSYQLCLAAMFTVSCSMLIWMKHKGYIDMH